MLFPKKSFRNLIQFIFIIFLFHVCSSTKEIRILSEASGAPISLKGKFINPPPIFAKKTYNLELRFYKCESTDFGKKKADTGIYPKKKDDCRNVYYSKKINSDEKGFEIQSNTLEGWTHGFIRILDLDEISGMYSVGENPFWFQPTDLVNSTISHNFSFISTENPIPDSEQIKLAEKFSPIIVLKKNKKFIPTNLSKYSTSFVKKTYTGKKKDSEIYEFSDALSDDYLELDESLYGKGDTHVYFHTRYVETFVSGTNPKALPGWRDNRNYYYNKGKGDIIISYYLWYDYNEGPSGFGNKHEGDMESFAVLVDSKGTPKRFMVTGHDHIMLDTSWENINSFENHPVIFIAHGRGNADGGNPTSAYGGYETSLEAGNTIFNWLADPKDVFPEIGENSQLIIPSNLQKEDLKNLRIGPGEWIDSKSTKYIDASAYVSRKIERLVKWEEPGWINKKADKDPDKNHTVSKEDEFYMNFAGRIGRNPRSSLSFLTFTQYGRSPVNVPFKMNIEQHFTIEYPREDRCEKVRVGDYCPKFQGDSKTPQFKGKGK